MSENIDSVILFYSAIKKTKKPVINLQGWVEYMICCDDTFLYKMSCSKSIAAYLSSKIDFFMMFQKKCW